MTDPYKILGVDPSASEQEIKSAYKKLAKQHHPDRGGDEKKFIEINAAYESIKGGNSYYDQYNEQSFYSTNNRTTDPFNFNSSFNFDDLFAQHFNRTPRNQDISITVYVELEDVYNCSTKTIAYRLNNGKTREVDINIPKGVTENTKVRFAGFGDNTKPGPAGNLFVTFRIKTHTEYKVENYDLVKRVNINVKEAMIGSDKRIDTLDGRSLMLHIKPGTQCGTRLRIPEGGLPRRDAPSGNLYIEIKVNIPILSHEDLTKRLNDLF